jgi:hypothetical protein
MSPITQHKKIFSHLPRRGWSMIETTSATAIVSILLVGSLQTVAQSLQFRVTQEEGLIADCLAESLFIEISTLSFVDPIENTTQLGRESSETSSTNRSNWDDIDDYHQLAETTLCYRDGTAIPNTTGWKRGVTVFISEPTSLADGSNLATPLRRIEIALTSPTGKTFNYQQLIGRESLRPSATQIGNNNWTSIEALWNSASGNLLWAVPLRNAPLVTGTGK